MQFHLREGKVGDRRVLREDLMAEYHAIQYRMPDQRTGYCLGLYREVVSNTYDIAHPGGGRGFQSLMILFPELDFGVTLLTNKNWHKLTGSAGRGVISAPIYNRLGPNPLADSGAEGLTALAADDPRVRGILGRYGTSAFDGNKESLHTIERNGKILLFRTSWGEVDTLTIYADGDKLIGTYGEVSEMRFLPPMAGRPGSMMTSGRWWSDMNLHFHDFNDSPSDPPGPDDPSWRRFVGTYDMLWNDTPTVSIPMEIRNGYFYYGESKCRELEPGLFLSHDGQVIDFTSRPPTAANLKIRKRSKSP
jgi:hypothetical protein